LISALDSSQIGRVDHSNCHAHDAPFAAVIARLARIVLEGEQRRNERLSVSRASPMTGGDRTMAASERDAVSTQTGRTASTGDVAAQGSGPLAIQE
jgi:hypothetical protein